MYPGPSVVIRHGPGLISRASPNWSSDRMFSWTAAPFITVGAAGVRANAPGTGHTSNCRTGDRVAFPWASVTVSRYRYVPIWSNVAVVTLAAFVPFALKRT